jgi:hypothetical protein
MKSRTKTVLLKPNKKNTRKISKKLGEKGTKGTISAEKTVAKTATLKAISLVKLVGISMRLMEQNNHLQGLYAELGKMLYDQQLEHGKHAAVRLSAECKKLAEKIAEMRKKMALLENEAAQLKKVVHFKQ